MMVYPQGARMHLIAYAFGLAYYAGAVWAQEGVGGWDGGA